MLCTETSTSLGSLQKVEGDVGDFKPLEPWTPGSSLFRALIFEIIFTLNKERKC